MNKVAVFAVLAVPVGVFAAWAGLPQYSPPQSGAGKMPVKIQATYWIATPEPAAPQPPIAPAEPAAPLLEAAAASVGTTMAPLPTAPPPTAAPIQVPTDAATAIVVPVTTEADAGIDIGPDASVEAMREDLLRLHNQARDAQQLPPYSVSLLLQQAAQSHAQWLALKSLPELWSLGAHAHTGEGGSTYQTRIAAAGYPGRAINESFGAFATVADAFDWWQGDPWHRPQIFATNYQEIGLGVVRHRSGQAIVFIVTFGGR
jgi:uncharacterized protein YkwD